MRRKNFSPHFALFQPQAESGRSVSLLGHLAAMMGPPGGPGGVVVGCPPRTPAQTRVYAAPGDVPTRCPRDSRGFGSAIHRFLTLPLAPGRGRGKGATGPGVGLCPRRRRAHSLHLAQETAVLSYDRHDHEHAGLAHEGGEGPGGDRGGVRVGCSVPNVDLLVVHYHLRGWWC